MSIETFKIKKETIDKNIEVVQEKTKEIYQQEKGATPEQIFEIKEELEKIPNFVINFDETMTNRDTISKVLDYLIEELPERAGEIKEKREGFGKIIKESRLAKEKGIKPPITPVKYFYENVINGIQADKLDKIYDRIIEETELNPNLEKTFEYLKKELKISKIPLFILSLNNKDLIKKFYQKNSEFFKRHNVEIIDIIGNQIKTNENGQITGVYEHVTDQNKKEYIPSQAIMLADDRETKDLVEKGVNVINIQGEKFNYEILDISLKSRDLQTDIDKITHRTDEEKNFLEMIKSQSIKKTKEIKIKHEENHNIDILN
jgi:uncharacterized protein YaiI (UPF0178 family)